MIVRAGVGEIWLYVRIFDLDTNNEISRVVSLDSESGEIERYNLGQENTLYPETTKEIRRFYVVDKRSLSEICRTK